MIKEYFINAAARYLRERGYLVVERRFPMILVSNGTVCADAERLEWNVKFAVPPYIIALDDTLVTFGAPTYSTTYHVEEQEERDDG